MGKTVNVNGWPVAVGTAHALSLMAADFKQQTGLDLLVENPYGGIRTVALAEH